MDLSETLLATLSPDDSIRSAAEGNLELLQERDLANFLLSLSVELSRDESNPESRRLAGIVLRNSLDLKGCATDKELQQWLYLDQSIKSKIKESLLKTLGSSVAVARLTSSQVIAKIASIEIPHQEWQDLIAKLLGNMTQQGASPPLRQATLVALVYICEAIELEQKQVNGVLNVVVQAMNQAEPNTEVCLAAVKALYNIFGCAAANFADEDVRNHIMGAVCEVLAKSEDLEIQHAIFECLAKIASTYYMLLQPYLRTILIVTESIAPQCMVFWCTVCKEVIKLREEQHIRSVHANSKDYCFIYEALELQVPVLLKHLFKREKDQEGLVRMLLQHLSNQEEDQEGDAFMQEEDQEGDAFMQEEDQEGDDCLLNLDIDCVTFLGLIARTIRDAIVPLVMQCVEGNIKAPDWHSRMADVSVIVFILEGPSVKGLSPLLDLLLDKMEDPNSEVKGTNAWILGWMFKLLHFSASANGIITKANLPRIMYVLVHGSKDIPIVSEKVCGAIYFLARGYEDAESMPSELSSSLDRVIDALLSASQPSDETPFRLGTSAYEALCAVVRVNNLGQHVVSSAIGNLMHCTMKRLDMTLDRQALALGHKLKKNNLQIVLCGVLQVIIQKLATAATVKIVSNAAHHLLFSFCRVLVCDSSAAEGEAISWFAIAALANATGPEFGKHMPILMQVLDAHPLSPISIGVISDICLVLEGKMLPRCDKIMQVLYKGLSKSTLRAPILSCFGDIVVAISNDFEKYLQYVLEKLQEAANSKDRADVLEEDEIEHVNQLRQGICYSGILWGIMDRRIGFKVATHLFKFMEVVWVDRSRDKSAMQCCCCCLDRFSFDN